MSVDQTTYAGELVVVTCWCGIRLGLPAELRRHQMREHDEGRQFVVWCPLGHQFVPTGKSRADRLREMADAVRRRAAAARGQLTKLRNRVANGVCPAPGCRRSFTQVHDHIRTCHPDLVHLIENGAES